MSIIDKLENEIGIIDLRYGKGKFGKVKVEYKLNFQFFENDCYRRVVFIRNSRLIKFLDNWYGKNVLNDKYLKYEVNVGKRLSVEYNEGGLNMVLEKRLNRVKNAEYYEKDWDYLSNKERKRKNIGWSNDRVNEYLNKGRISFELLKLDIESVKYGGLNFRGYSSDENFSGRISNIINNKEKEFRKFIKIDGENVVEIDMVNGYVSLLYRVMLGIRDLEYGVSSFDDKIKDVVGDVNGNDFLDKYKLCFGGKKEERKDFYSLVGLEFGKIEWIVGEDERSYIKGLVLYLINGEISDGRRKRYLDGKYSYDEMMIKIFGKGGYSVINRIKESSIDFKFGKSFYGYERFKNMSKVLMFMEVRVMKSIWDELIKRNISYVSLYDGMLVKKKERDDVMVLVNKVLINEFDCIRMKVKEI